MVTTEISPAGSRRRIGPAAAHAACGFTLLEVLLALALMALAAGLVVPALVKPAATQLRTTGSQVVSLLRRSREHAIDSQGPSVVRIDVRASRLESASLQSEVQIPRDVRLELFTARSELESESAGRIRFFPDGSSTGGRVTLSIDQRRYLVDVDWLTGRISVLDPDRAASAPASYQVLR